MYMCAVLSHKRTMCGPVITLEMKTHHYLHVDTDQT